MEITILPYSDADKKVLWKIFSKTTKQESGFIQDESCTHEEWETNWFNARCMVFSGRHEHITIGAYVLQPNHPGRGNHIANCRIMIADDPNAQSIGKQLGKHALQKARELGYKAVQLNAILSTDEIALTVLRIDLGFNVVGYIPKAYHHPNFGYVDTYVMHKTV